MLCHLFDHFESTRVGESGLLMGVHLADLLSSGGLAIASFSDSVRVNTRYNLLELHI